MKEIKLTNGETLVCRLNYTKLYELECRRPEVYKIYNDIVMEGAKTEFDYIKLLFVAYVCNLNPEGIFENFMEILPFGIKNATIASAMLTNPN